MSCSTFRLGSQLKLLRGSSAAKNLSENFTAGREIYLRAHPADGRAAHRTGRSPDRLWDRADRCAGVRRASPRACSAPLGDASAARADDAFVVQVMFELRPADVRTGSQETDAVSGQPDRPTATLEPAQRQSKPPSRCGRYRKWTTRFLLHRPAASREGAPSPKAVERIIESRYLVALVLFETATRNYGNPGPNWPACRIPRAQRSAPPVAAIKTPPPG